MDLIRPHGDKLTELLASPQRVQELRQESVHLPSWDLTPHEIWDIELLLNGAFSPLAGFMGQDDYTAVCHRMRLANGLLWPIPITLAVTEAFVKQVALGDRIALRHPEGMVLAVMTITDLWQPDLKEEAQLVYGTTDNAHPGVFRLLQQTNPVCIGGPVEGLELPPHHTFKHLRHTPAGLRDLFRSLSWEKVVAFQTRNPLHRAHVELTRRAMQAAGAHLLIHPVVGRTSPGDIDYFTRVRCYEAVVKHYPDAEARLSLLPLAMRMAGPREAVWHAIIRQNFGCTHFIVGRDHAGPKRSSGQPFYEPHAAVELLSACQPELRITAVPFEELVYVKELSEYVSKSQVAPGMTVLSLSGTELRHRLREGLEIPEWFSFPEVIKELYNMVTPKSKRGFTVFFTGLPSAGKSTIANVLMTKLMEIGSRPVTLLDGDIVRKNLSSELGFSKADRDLNVKRIGFVASEITKNRGCAICAPIAPYRSMRRAVRELIEQHGGFIEVYVATPLLVCEARDRKCLYAKARAGLIENFTGINDPYEAPENPELVVDTSTISAEDAANKILGHLEQEGYLQ